MLFTDSDKVTKTTIPNKNNMSFSMTDIKLTLDVVDNVDKKCTALPYNINIKQVQVNKF